MRPTLLIIGCAMVATVLLGARAGSATTWNECVQACRATESDCLFDAGERAEVCRELCSDERLTYRDACLGETVEESCPDTRHALQSCLSACGDALSTDQGKCSQVRQECISTTCPRPHPFPGRGGTGSPRGH
jgi:hypothetical protein